MTREGLPRELNDMAQEPKQQPTLAKGSAAGDRPVHKLLSILAELLTPDLFSRRRAVTRRLGPTAWLDGLRGWAALCVAFMHITVYTHEGLELCYGAKIPTENRYNDSWAALPFIRLPFTGGHFSVMLFFVISGYVVPRRLLTLLHEGRRDDFMENLHSAMIRRPVRLFMPVVLSTLMLWIVWHLFGIHVPWPRQRGNIFAEAANWVSEMAVFAYFYKIGYLYTYYNVHTWTIPVEFRGSMFLFFWLFALHTVKTRTRVMLTLAMTLYLAIACPGAWFACFFGGLVLSELELLSTESSALQITFPWDSWDRWLRSKKVLRSVMLHLLLLASIYLACQPSSDWSTRDLTLGNCPGWQTLSWMIPSTYLDEFSQFRWFWLFWGAWMMVYAVRELAWVRSLFETHTAQCVLHPPHRPAPT